MLKKIILTLTVIILFTLVACVENHEEPPIVEDDYPDASLSIDEKIEWWLERLTVEEKAGQMVQGERSNNNGQTGVTPAMVRDLNLGSVLNGGGNVPPQNNVSSWYQMYQSMLNASLQSSSKIPIIYGVDAVHGHANLQGATVFPHNIGLAAANNAELMKDIGEVIAYEVSQTGLTYNFAPSIGVIKDKRWGRTYETLGENPQVAANLVGPYIEGIQSYNVAGSAKHFVGDSYTIFGTGLDGKLDRGNSIITQEELEEIHYPLYQAAIDAGVKTIMVSYSSLNGVRMHENKELVTDVLKDEFGFKGFVMGDYNGIDDINATTFNQKVIKSINAGVDMLMQPHNFESVINVIIGAVNSNLISMERMDDAVSRILRVKYEIGLFEEKERIASDLRNEHALSIARQAVRESMVLLKNENQVLPLNKSQSVLLLGPGSDNIGIQSGGWTITWQGSDQLTIPGHTIKDALEEVMDGTVYTSIDDLDKADVVIVVLAEKPHAEMMGDSLALSLISDTAYTSNLTYLNQIKDIEKPVLAMLIASKPLLVNDYISDFDAFVMLFLPGTEGLGITDVLLGEHDFKGKLPYTWPKTLEQAHHTYMDNGYNPNDYQFPYGFGLTYNN
ncbi:Periplasmic beta-glucosidase precursor [Acholeplasma oculi]|uniref:beta-glucosidase n=1 Tax=Acholeplasma oculi TaxID=35623 RepID=A0A061AIP3_9MOLU|nr:glycoside hydrolase family 3 protein [Acholeplasma oculi]CDR30857.1 Glycoside hydrolase family 3 protein [Acholeplasma oculi]SKC35304.1 beta-glucosidase [Acholeplasma oculi]SUT89939.1 Periplasmic beta-glucosidase precursor [Acholeplasma oculi]